MASPQNSSQSELAVYLAARFSRKDEIKEKAKELEAMGIHVTSRWLEESAVPNSNLNDASDEYLLNVALIDIQDIDSADLLILFTEDPKEAFVRGGRHFESGYAYGTKKPVLTLGPRENVFHYLENVINVENWEDLKANLKFLKQVHRKDF
jgi:nucleoside 2-deoxyribosyltransferase